MQWVSPLPGVTYLRGRHQAAPPHGGFALVIGSFLGGLELRHANATEESSVTDDMMNLHTCAMGAMPIAWSR